MNHQEINAFNNAINLSWLILLIVCSFLLGCRSENEKVTSLIADLSDSHLDVRDTAGAALARIGSPAVEPLIAELSNNDPYIRSEAARILGEIKDARAVKPLIAVLQDTETTVRSNAIYALSQLKNATAVEPLIALFNDKDSHIREFSAERVGAIGAPSVEPLIAALKTEKDTIRWCIVTALGRSNDPRAVIPLINSLNNDPNPVVRMRAASALGYIKDPRAIEPLIVALDEDRSSIAWDASNALVEIGSPAVEPLIVALNNKNPAIRSAAAIILGVINDVRSIDPLLDVLKNGNSTIRSYAAQALSMFNDQRVDEYLISAFKNKDLEVIAGAYIFFIRRGEQGSEDMLMKALNEYGRKNMAIAFLNSGNLQLEECSRKWANKRGYSITSVPAGDNMITWGN